MSTFFKTYLSFIGIVLLAGCANIQALTAIVGDNFVSNKISQQISDDCDGVEFYFNPPSQKKSENTLLKVTEIELHEDEEPTKGNYFFPLDSFSSTFVETRTFDYLSLQQNQELLSRKQDLVTSSTEIRVLYQVFRI